MQSYGLPLISVNTNNLNTLTAATDVLETKAVAEYERERKRAHKGHDTKRKSVAVDHHHHTADKQSVKVPAWKRAGGGERQQRVVLSRLGRDAARDEDEEEASWADDLAMIAAEEEEEGKENRRSPQTPSVRLEDLVVRSAHGKSGRKHSRQLTSRPSTPRQATTTTTMPTVATTGTPLTDLLAPLMDTVNILDNHLYNTTTSPYNTTDSFDNDSDDMGYFEFSSPGADEWTVAVTEEGYLTYSTTLMMSKDSSSVTTSVAVMPCDW